MRYGAALQPFSGTSTPSMSTKSDSNKSSFSVIDIDDDPMT